jgi:hypothetical protein
MQITEAQFEGYHRYLDWVTNIGEGAFAVSEDGKAWGSYGCPKGNCIDVSDIGVKSVRRCEEYSNGSPCHVFAVSRDVVVPYKVSG